jgi:hypothetical protein
MKIHLNSENGCHHTVYLPVSFDVPEDGNVVTHCYVTDWLTRFEGYIVNSGTVLRFAATDKTQVIARC